MWIFKSHRTAMSQTTPAAPHAQPPQHTALAQALQRPYQYGFVTDIEADSLPPGLDEDTIRAISRKKHEPDFRLQWRLAAFARWRGMAPPHERARLAGVAVDAVSLEGAADWQRRDFRKKRL